MLSNCAGENSWGSLGQQGDQPVNANGNQSWIFNGRTDAEAETPILWPPDVKSQLIWKDSDAWKDWRQKEKGTTEDEMFGCDHQSSGHDWASSRRWWRAGKTGVLLSMGSQRDGHDLATEQQQHNLSKPDNLFLKINYMWELPWWSSG